MVLGKRTYLGASRLPINLIFFQFKIWIHDPRNWAVHQTHTDYTNLSTLPNTPYIYSKICNVHCSPAGDLPHIKFYRDDTLLKAIWSHFQPIQMLKGIPQDLAFSFVLVDNL